MVYQETISKKLESWLRDKFKDSNLLIRKEVKAHVNDFQMRADLIAIQSKSNVIHAFEIKNSLNPKSWLSAIWQANSLYSNYRWLVISSDFSISKSIIADNHKLDKLGIGIIAYNLNENDFDFEIVKEAKYRDGNFLKFWPRLESDWSENKKN